MTILKYVVVQRTGFVPYFLSAWIEGTDRWDCQRARALCFNGPTARKIAQQLSDRYPGSPIPAVVEIVT